MLANYDGHNRFFAQSGLLNSGGNGLALSGYARKSDLLYYCLYPESTTGRDLTGSEGGIRYLNLKSGTVGNVVSFDRRDTICGGIRMIAMNDGTLVGMSLGMPKTYHPLLFVVDVLGKKMLVVRRLSCSNSVSNLTRVNDDRLFFLQFKRAVGYIASIYDISTDSLTEFTVPKSIKFVDRSVIRAGSDGVYLLCAATADRPHGYLVHLNVDNGIVTEVFAIHDYI